MNSMSRKSSINRELHARPVHWGKRCVFLFRSLLICRLAFLTVDLRAGGTESGHGPAAVPFQDVPHWVAGISNAGTAQKGLNGSNSPADSQFEQPPQKVDIFQLQQLQLMAAENRERSQKRIALPPNAMAKLPEVDPSNRAGHSGTRALAATTRLQMSNAFSRGCLFILVAATGFLVARKFIPEFNEFIGTLLHSRSRAARAALQRPAIMREGEESFLEFQAKLCGGLRAPGGGANERADSAAAGLFTLAGRHIDRIRKDVQAARLSTAEAEQRRILGKVQEQIQPLKDLMIHPELQPLQQMTSALEQLVRQLTEKAGSVNSSTLRTVTQSVELMAKLCEPESRRSLLTAAPLRILVVDDETFSRHALSVALSRSFNAPDIAEHAEAALKLAATNTYDLIFLDVQMPGMDGFELCAKIHETALNRQTPVVFVTAQRGFNNRSKSIVCGGKDIISKPFLPNELTVKTLTLVAHERLHGRVREAGTAGNGMD
jgi:CheY-like chemotaxis protein